MKNKETKKVQNALLQKLISAIDDDQISILSEQKILKEKDNIPTDIPAINLALSGNFDDGLKPGLLTIAGPSKHFKTLYLLIMMKSYLKQYPDSVAYLFDSEFGAAFEYFDSLDIDKDRVIHAPIVDVEDLKYKIMNILNVIKRGDKVFIGIDSLGNLASKKEIDDAIDGKSVADMTRAKALKSLGRMVTPHLAMKNIPMIVINHTYKTLEMFSKDVMAGGTGIMYSSNDVWIVGRQQEKATSGDKELLGYNFIINIEKSRSVKEKSKIPVTVLFDDGIYKFSGILDLGEELDFISGDKKTGYKYKETLYKKAAEIRSLEKILLSDADFKAAVMNKYTLATNKLITEETESDAD